MQSGPERFAQVSGPGEHHLTRFGGGVFIAESGPGGVPPPAGPRSTELARHAGLLARQVALWPASTGWEWVQCSSGNPNGRPAWPSSVCGGSRSLTTRAAPPKTTAFRQHRSRDELLSGSRGTIAEIYGLLLRSSRTPPSSPSSFSREIIIPLPGTVPPDGRASLDKQPGQDRCPRKEKLDGRALLRPAAWQRRQRVLRAGLRAGGSGPRAP